MAKADIENDVEDDFEDDAEGPPPPRTHHFENFVRENPVAAVTGALVIGIILGRIGIL